MKAFTYLIINKTNLKWYYGVRYAKNCKLTDIFTKYFTSSVEIKELIKEFGTEMFDVSIRKTFDDIEIAKLWEVRVLKRMKVRTNPNSYNKHYNLGFVTYSGDENHSKRPEVRKILSDKAKARQPHTPEILEKISATKIKNSIIKFLKLKYI